MALMIQLTPTEEERLQADARRNGVAPTEFARQLLSRHLAASESNGLTPDLSTQLQYVHGITVSLSENNREHFSEARDAERVARVRSLRGKFAQAGRPLASEELHRERRRDKASEEAQSERHPL